jgi:hypothetical protein
MTNFNFTVDQEIKFINKKKETHTGIYIKDYIYPKTGETFYLVNFNGKKRLLTKKQICNEVN